MSFADDFNRANGVLGNGWLDGYGGAGYIQVVNNATASPAPTVAGATAYRPEVFIDLKVEWTQVTDLSYAFIRSQNPSAAYGGSCYLAYSYGGWVVLYRLPEWTQLASVLGNQTRIGLQAVGNQLTVFGNGSQLLTATDNTYTSGYAGIVSHFAAGTNSMDDFVLTPSSILSAQGFRGMV